MSNLVTDYDSQKRNCLCTCSYNYVFIADIFYKASTSPLLLLRGVPCIESICLSHAGPLAHPSDTLRASC